MKTLLTAGLVALSPLASWAQDFDLDDIDLLEVLEGALACRSEPSDCADQLLEGPLAPLVWPAVERYRELLFDQAEGRWSTLPRWFVTAARPYYPGLDLTQVRYAEGIQTLHGRDITWGESIFFTRPIDLDRYEDAHAMLHELEHVRQYHEAGGERPFLTRYLADSLEAIAESGSIDVHGQLELEQAAEATADRIAGAVFDSRR